MDRRAFIGTLAGSLLTAPLVAEAHGERKVYRVGVLDSVGLASSQANLDAFRQGLRELGHVEGQHFVIEYRSAEDRAERLPDLAAELVRLKVDVIVTGGTAAALGARHVTETIPIVMAASNAPVFAGLVASLARPRGNVTGLHLGVPPELAGTRLRLLKELIPGLSRVGVFLDSGDVYAQLMMREIEPVARATGVQLHTLGARRPAGLEQAFEAAVMERVDALVVMEGILTVSDLPRIVDFAAMSRLPAIYGLREFVDAGGLMAYGPDPRDLFRRAATYVHRIIREGARPADLPVQPPAKLALVINLKTAKALGLTIPQSVLARADEVIE